MLARWKGPWWSEIKAETPCKEKNSVHFGIPVLMLQPKLGGFFFTMSVVREEAKQVRDIGSLIFETPIQHDYEAGVEVRSLLSTERLEEIDGRLAVNR